ncbi:MAG: glycosyltransferase family 2 protein [Nitrospinota bacterium]|nr:MAG: glycosyltransferase family 2 protein [Nitrospinota bacterium]
MRDLTIGLVTWKARDLLQQCLDAIEANLDNLRAEVWVVDNASQDGTLELLRERYPTVSVVQNPRNRGVAPARNQIIERAQGRYLLFLDVDTRVLPGALTTLVQFMDEHPEVAIGGPKLLYGDGSLQLSCRPFPSPLHILVEGTFLRDYFPQSRWVKEYTMEEWDHAETREVDWMYGACLIVRRQALEKLGGFDEGFFYLYEDIDLCFRAKRLGMKVCYIPQAQVIHFLERERKSVFHPRIFTHIRSILRYLIKDYYGNLWSTR